MYNVAHCALRLTLVVSCACSVCCTLTDKLMVEKLGIIFLTTAMEVILTVDVIAAVCTFMKGNIFKLLNFPK